MQKYQVAVLFCLASPTPPHLWADLTLDLVLRKVQTMRYEERMLLKGVWWLRQEGLTEAGKKSSEICLSSGARGWPNTSHTLILVFISGFLQHHSDRAWRFAILDHLWTQVTVLSLSSVLRVKHKIRSAQLQLGIESTVHTQVCHLCAV